MSALVFVKTVGVGDFLRHQVLVSTRLLNHIFQHLINNGRLVGSTRLHAADESI